MAGLWLCYTGIILLSKPMYWIIYFYLGFFFQEKCWLCVHLQFCRPNCGLFFGLRRFCCFWIGRFLQQVSQKWASNSWHGDTLGYFCMTFDPVIKTDYNGIYTFTGFLYFWGIIFLITTTLVWLLKKEQRVEPHHKQEKKSDDDYSSDLNVVDTYKLLLKIFKLRTIQLTVLVLLTCKVCP